MYANPLNDNTSFAITMAVALLVGHLIATRLFVPLVSQLLFVFLSGIGLVVTSVMIPYVDYAVTGNFGTSPECGKAKAIMTVLVIYQASQLCKIDLREEKPTDKRAAQVEELMRQHARTRKQ